jgi:pyridoxal phosphate enzyme (YggS family)
VSDAVEAAVARVRERIALACVRSGRAPGSVRLIAVTKTVPAETIRQAVASAGLTDLGENRARDLAAKAASIPATWHFLGKLQRGTAHLVAANAAWVHSAEPGTGLAALARHAARSGARLRCLVQVDFLGTRQGVAPEEAANFVEQARSLVGLDIVGLMTLPPATADPEGARPYFAQLRELLERLSRAHPGLQELSMGMSADYQVAVEEGATMVRIGRALFQGADQR